MIEDGSDLLHVFTHDVAVTNFGSFRALGLCGRRATEHIWTKLARNVQHMYSSTYKDVSVSLTLA